MKIESVEFKNFNSYGNKTTRIDFTNDANMIMLIGQVGHGKSTLREVISYLAYGKVQDKTLGDLPNRINKSLWGRIVMIANNSRITIERGMKPSIFEVSIDGKPLETAGKGNVQDTLETEYFRIPQSTFDNIISVSVDKFKSFLTMRAKDKRKILDQIFGILFFNKINDQIKDKIKDFNKQIENLEGQVKVLNENKTIISNKINEIDTKKSEDTSTRLAEIVKQIEDISNEVEKLVKESSEIQKKIQKVNFAYQKTLTDKSKCSTNIKNKDNKIALYDNDTCPECMSSLKTKKHQKLKEGIEKEKQDLIDALAEYEVQLKKITKIKDSLDKKNKGIGDKLFDVKMGLGSLQQEKKKLDKPVDTETNEFDSVLQNTIDKIDEIVETLGVVKKDEYIYSELSRIFGEDGVKLQIMKNFLPSFNKNINDFSKQLHFPYKIEIDEKFNSRIISIGEEISAKTLSTGETRTANFAVLVSLIKIMKRNYPNINLLFLDEILASIDSYGVYEMLKLIRDVVDDLKLHAFVINHSELPSELFNNIYSVNKVAGFSELEIKPC